MQQEEILVFWGKENLIRWPEIAFQDIDIPSVSFLAAVGLPPKIGQTMRFGVDEGQLPRVLDHYWRIGFDGEVPICLDELNGGRVVALGQLIGGKESYVNASVESFAECIVYYQQYRVSVRGMDDDQATENVAATEKRMRAADPTAFSNPGNWWLLIIEQMNQGVL